MTRFASTMGQMDKVGHPARLAMKGDDPLLRYVVEVRFALRRMTQDIRRLTA